MIVGEHIVELGFGHGEPTTEVVGVEDAEERSEEVSESGKARSEDGHVGYNLLIEDDIQNVVRHLDGIDVDGTERLEDFASTTVLFARNPFEVVVTIVRNAAVLMVAFTEMSFFVEGSRSLESKEDDDMATPIAILPHSRIVVSSFAVMAMHTGGSHTEREAIKDLSEFITGEREEMTFAI